MTAASARAAPSIHDVLMEGSLDAIILMDASGAILHFNRAAEQMFGFARGDVLGKSVADTIIPPSIRDRHREGLKRYLETGAGPFLRRRVEVTALRSDGTEFPVELTIDVAQEGGSPVFVGSLRDISVRVFATGRLEALARLATALASARTRAEVAEVVVTLGMGAAGADTCTLYLLDDTGHALDLVAERGVAPEIVDRLRRLTRQSEDPAAFATMRTRRSLWAENEAQYREIFPATAASAASGPRAKAFWSVPLVVEGQPVGLLGMGFYEARRFSPDERAFVDTFAQQCGQALLRAARYEGEREARHWLTTTLRSIGDAVIATDTAGRVAFMNPVAEDLTGWTEELARGRLLDEVFRIVSEGTLAPVESPVTKVLREGAVVGLADHTALRSRSGAQIPIDDSGAPIKDDAGKLFGVVLVFRDATREQRAAARRSFLMNAGEVLASAMTDHRETLSRVARLAVPRLADWCAIDLVEPGEPAPRQVALAHVDPEQIARARALAQRYPPDGRSPMGVPNVIRTGKSELYRHIPGALLEAAAVDAEHLRLIRELRIESAMVVPLSGKRRTFGAITFAYAASGRRYAEDDLAFAEDFARRASLAIENALALKEAADARTEAEIANRAKDEFLATVSHELRTPLNAILGWTVIIRDRRPPEDVGRALAVIERNARAQARLIEDLLDVSRIMSGKLALKLAPASVADVVRAAAEAVRPAAEAKELAIDVEIRDPGLTIVADADRLQQVVWNLLSNAVKFARRGGSVAASAALDGSVVRIDVVDDGEGIAPEALPRIFEAFRQADSSTTRMHGGLGLGLAIVRQLVTAHGGTVSAASPGQGRGATFTVRLPARSATRSVARAASRASSTMVDAQAMTATESVPRLDGLKLLVVDDEPDARDLIAEVLRDHGAIVETASSAEEALGVFDRAAPDVLVSDIGMPRMDGYSLIRKLRMLPADRGGRTPAIALTAYARAEDAQRAFAAGYQSHVTKPVEPSQLATVVANLGGRSLDG